MFLSKYKNFKVFYIFLGLGLPLVPSNTHAGQGLKAMAEAQQNAYLGVRKLGEKATPAQIDQIAKSAASDANRKLNEDHASTFKNWRSVLRKKHDQIAAEHEPQLKKQVAANGAKPSLDRDPASVAPKSTSTINNSIKARNAKSDTGAYEGEGTVSVIDFSKKK